MANLLTETFRGPAEPGASDLVLAGEGPTGVVPSMGQAAGGPTDSPPAAGDSNPGPPSPSGASPRQRDTSPHPTHIGRFEIRAYVGGGGFGDVYRGYDTQLERAVALKVPRERAMDSPQRRQRFLNEARAAAQLRHPHIVPIYEVGSDNDRPYIAFAFIEGNTLAEARDQGRLNLSNAVSLVRDLAEALAYAHRLGIVHSDVKPANVLLDRDDRCHLADFGLAHRYDGTSEAGKEHAGPVRGISGTPVYMSPEHWSGLPGAVGPASDQYSLGVVLYELMCGFPPFEGPLKLLKFNHEKRLPDAPRSCNPSLPHDLEAICLKTLAKTPQARYGSCQELADDLRRWLEGEPVRARRMSSGERLVRWCRREPALAVALGFALTFLLAFALVMFHSAGRERRVGAQLRQAYEQIQEYAAEAVRGWSEADERRKVADEKTREALRHAASSRIDQALILCESGEVGQGLVRLADARRLAVQADAGDLVLVIDINLGAWRRQLHAIQNVLPQSDKVTAAAYGKDAHLVVTACGPEVCFWDARTGERRPIVLPSEPGDRVTALSLGGPRDSLLLVARLSHVELWDLTLTAAHLASFTPAEKTAIQAATLSPDGKSILLGGGTRDGSDGWACLWMPERNQSIALSGLRDTVWATAFSRDSSQCLTGSGNRFGGMAQIYDTQSGQALAPPLEHSRAVTAAAFSPDGTEVLTGTRGLFQGEAQLWDVASGQRKGAPLLRGLEIFAVAYSPDGTQAAIGGQDRAVRLWDLRSRQPIGSPMRHAKDVNSVTFRPDGRMLLTASDDGTACLWQLATGLLPSYSCDHLGPVLAAAANPRKPLFCTAAASRTLTRHGLGKPSGEVRVWSWRTGERQSLLAHTTPVSAVAWHPEGRLLLTGCWDGKVRLWDTQHQSDQPLWEISSQQSTDWVQALAFSPDGQRFAVAWRGGRVEVRTTDQGNRVVKVLAPPGIHYALAFRPSQDRYLLTASQDGKVRQWDAQTGQQIGSSMDHPDAVLSAVYSDDGKCILSGYAGGALLWEAETGKQVLPPFLHQAGVFAVAFGPRQTLLTAGTDGLAHLWHLHTGKPLGPPFPHGGAILAAAFTREKEAVLTAGLNWYARVWPVADRVEASAEQLAPWATVITGIELRDDGTIGVLKPAAWQKLRKATELPAIETTVAEEVAARLEPVVPRCLPNPHRAQSAPQPAQGALPLRQPPERLPAVSVVQIDVSSLRSWLNTQPHLRGRAAPWNAQVEMLPPLLKSMGLSLLARTDRLTLVASGSLDRPQLTLFLHTSLGREAFDRLVRAYAHEHPEDVRLEKDGRLPLYLFTMGGQQMHAAFSEEGPLVIATSRPALHVALDAGEAGVTLEQEIVPGPLPLRGQEVVGLAALLQEEMRKRIGRRIEVPDDVVLPLRGLNTTLEVHDRGLGVDLSIYMEDRSSARRLSTVLSHLRQQANKEELADDLKKGIENAGIRVEGSVVRLHFLLTPQALVELFAKSQG